MEQISSPPLASPHGGGNPLSPMRQKASDKRVAHLVVSLSFFAAVRYYLMEWLTPCVVGLLVGAPLVLALALFPILASRYGMIALPVTYVVLALSIGALSAPLNLIVRLCSRRNFAVEISRDGLSKLYPSRDIHFPWSKFSWIIERNGDLWLASFVDGCFIPREAFVSRQDAREFVSIVRELKRTNGTGWQQQWNERVFGVHPYGHIVSDELSQ